MSTINIKNELDPSRVRSTAAMAVIGAFRAVNSCDQPQIQRQWQIVCDALERDVVAAQEGLIEVLARACRNGADDAGMHGETLLSAAADQIREVACCTECVGTVNGLQFAVGSLLRGEGGCLYAPVHTASTCRMTVLLMSVFLARPTTSAAIKALGDLTQGMQEHRLDF